MKHFTRNTQANRRGRALSGFLLGLLLAACGGGNDTAGPGPATTGPGAGTTGTVIAGELAIATGLQGHAAPRYSVRNLAPGHYVATPAINIDGQVAMAVENGGGTRSYFFNGQVLRDIGTLGGPDATAVALNDAGQVTGAAAVEAGPEHAFLWSEANGMRDLGTLGGSASFGTAINDKGQVAGYAIPEPPVTRRAFRWDPKEGMVDIGFLPGESTSLATGINERGVVTGFTDTHSFIWTRSTGLRDIGSDAVATLINDANQVAGTIETPRLSAHAFVWTRADGLRDIGTLGGDQSFPYGMNNAGQVVGLADTAGNESHAMSWTRSGGMVDLGTLGGPQSQALAVNRSGQVVGQADTGGDDNPARAFLWTKAKGMLDLNKLVAPVPPGLTLLAALAMSDKGAIVADSNAGLVLLTPGSHSANGPLIGPVTPGTDHLQAGVPVTFSAAFADPDAASTHRARWNWGGACHAGAATVTESKGSGSVSGRQAWCAAGTYWITLTVTSNSGSSSTIAREVVVGERDHPSP